MFRVLPKATIGAVAIIVICFFVFLVFFHRYDPTANNIAAHELKQKAIDSDKKLEKALSFLKSGNYTEARGTVSSDFMMFSDDVWKQSLTIQKEERVYYYADFMATPDNKPITKYIQLTVLKPIDGFLTQQDIDQFTAKWKPLYEAARAEIDKKRDEALNGLTVEEKKFAAAYSARSSFKPNPDPAQVALDNINGISVAEAKKNGEKWMQDQRILEAIKKYAAIEDK